MNENITPIDVAFPDAEILHLRVSIGACRIKIAPSDGDAWVSGTYTDPNNTLPLKIEQEGGTLRITQDYRTGEWWNLVAGNPPKFDLALGKGKAYMLSIEGGASEGDIDLGGLPITRLSIKKGAGKWDFDFSAPNPQTMSLLELHAGAAGMEMDNLANANFSEMIVDGGAASYAFDFSGLLGRDGNVRISAGMAAVKIEVPSTNAARITTETSLGSLEVGDGFMKNEGAFWNQAALDGQVPLLTIYANVSLGSILLRQV